MEILPHVCSRFWVLFWDSFQFTSTFSCHELNGRPCGLLTTPPLPPDILLDRSMSVGVNDAGSSRPYFVTHGKIHQNSHATSFIGIPLTFAQAEDKKEGVCVPVCAGRSRSYYVFQDLKTGYIDFLMPRALWAFPYPYPNTRRRKEGRGCARLYTGFQESGTSLHDARLRLERSKK